MALEAKRGPFVKICGLKTLPDVDASTSADAIGFVMNRTSVRAIDADTVRKLVDHADGRALTVLVVNDMPAVDAARIAGEVGVDVLQLHNYSEADTADALEIFPRIWRATSLSRDPDLTVGAHGEELLLLDSPKEGSGKRWDLTALEGTAPTGPWLLAGGLSPDNVREALQHASPWGVDVSSGVESEPGVKDHDRIRRFIAEARETTLPAGTRSASSTRRSRA